MSRMRLVVVFAAAILLIAGLAEATSLIHLEDNEMAVQSDAIVVGRCASATTQWVRGTLVTLINVEVSEALKGAAPGALTLVVPGGVDMNREVPVSVIFPGAPSVVRDENVLLYLNESALVGGGYDITGFNQGKYSVVETAAGPMVTRGGGEAAMPLDAKKAQIAAALAAGSE